MQIKTSTNEKLINQVESWRNRLLDIGNRNPLINTSFNSTRGVLEFAHPESEIVWRKLVTAGEAGSRSLRFPWKRDLVPPPVKEESNGDVDNSSAELEVGSEKETKDWNPPIAECTASSKLRADDLLTTIGDCALDRRIRTLDGHADLSISEQGIHCLFLAFGFIKWFESADSSKEIRSPLILVPATFTRETSDSPWQLQEAEDDVVDNLCLRQRFKQDFGLELPPLPELDQLEEDGARLAYLGEVRKAIGINDRWEVEDRCCLGRFAFPKIAMWQDLGEHLNSIASNTICCSIGGQASDDPQVAFGDPSSVPNAKQLDDQVGPGEIKAILDCDSSQLEAIVAAKKGISFVLDGPPGTGKSQTIANIIADALSVGKRVLFVSEKVAALEVVKRRLDDCGLGDFCLECHSSKANRKAVLEELKWCLEIPVESYPDPNPKLNDLRKQREALNDYVRILHQPQQPIGMSMYELHGNIARLTRIGMLGRSRIEFTNPELVARSTLDGWIELLQLAPQHKNVLENLAKHPWRGCQLITQTLGMKSEIRDNFALLSEKATQLAQTISPLEEAGLIPVGTRPGQLKSLLDLFEVSLTIPDVPSTWFAAPRETAHALLDRNCSYRRSVELRQSLLEYIDDVTTIFTKDIIQLAALSDSFWLKRLTKALPDNFEDCRNTLTNHAQTLRGFEVSLATLENSLKQLIAEIKLPIKSDFPLGSVAKLLSVAKLIATDAPFRAAWFDSQQTTKIVDDASDAVSKLESISEMEQSVKERIKSDDLLKLAEEIEDVDELKRDWEFVLSKVPASQISNLDEFARQLTHEQEHYRRTDADLKSLAIALRWSSSFGPTVDEALAIIEALPSILTAGVYNGNWADAAKRCLVKQQIESVLLDLSEAQELRRELESRFSHRAFLPTARPLIDRGRRYTSWWTRIVGGYSKYRVEVADLYKSAVPETKAFLRDVLQLATFHKRMGEVDSTYQEMKDLLVPGVIADQMDSWQKALDAVNAFEVFISAAPHVASIMPTGEVIITLRPNDPLLTRLSETLRLNSSSETSKATESLGLANMQIHEALRLISSLQSSTNHCADVIRSGQAKYFTAPDMRQLLQDIALSKEYAGQRDEIESLYKARRQDLPEDASPFQLNTWTAAIRGINSADKLIKTFGASTVLQETVCTSGRVNRDALAVLIQSTESVLLQISKIWSEQVAFIDLSSREQQTMDLKKRIASELKTCVVEAAEEFETTSMRLSKLISLLKPGHSVPLERLPQDAKVIAELRRAESTTSCCNSILSKFGVDHPCELSDHECQACESINQASDDLLTSKLAQAIATCPQRRSQVTEILAKAKLLLEDIIEPIGFFGKIFDSNQNVSTGFVPKNLTLRELSATLQNLIISVESIDEWIQFNRWREQMRELHVGQTRTQMAKAEQPQIATLKGNKSKHRRNKQKKNHHKALKPFQTSKIQKSPDNQSSMSTVVEELINGNYQPEEAVDAVCAKLYQQLFDYFSFQERQIWDFNGDRHEQIRDRYRALDEWEIKAASARVREFQLSREDRPRIGWLAPMTSELGILKKETEKKRRHMPLRKLFNAVPGVLQRLKPCIMMSPLSVSTFLQAEALRFDLVIFDEASQVFPWDAIGAIYRGSQLIVAGDDKQLPPTSFFSRADIESEEEEDDIGDFESILSLCKSVNMPNKRLRWHYRSRREPLIAFSNKHFYDGDLVTFPSVLDAGSDAVQLIHVPDGIWTDRKNLPEARRVAELVVEHFRGKPDKSLGVIAFNATQQQAIEDAIYDLRRSSPVIDALLKEGPHEPLFIKNLENVQGDERDVILLSFGYGKNEAGKFIKNFGPLSKPGGERRLNVAVTRAREALSLVASVRSSDMDLSGSTSIGAQLLKAYLEYAEHGVDSISRSIVETQGKCESPFEEEVAAALIRHGLDPVPQVGCGGFRIDLALRHPAHPGLYCLGIECDGATYHSSKTARDRDRIRQSVLEGLGWRICRVWSTDWIRNPDQQLKRILSVYEQVAAIPPDITPNPASRPEPEFEDLQPRYVVDDVSKAPTYLKIEDVPTQQIIDTALRIVTRVGTIDWSELVSLTSRELGFGRTGKKIRERVESILHDQVRESNLHRIGDKMSIV